jgi:hypothetical protein
MRNRSLVALFLIALHLLFSGRPLAAISNVYAVYLPVVIAPTPQWEVGEPPRPRGFYEE